MWFDKVADSVRPWGSQSMAYDMPDFREYRQRGVSRCIAVFLITTIHYWFKLYKDRNICALSLEIYLNFFRKILAIAISIVNTHFAPILAENFVFSIFLFNILPVTSLVDIFFHSLFSWEAISEQQNSHVAILRPFFVGYFFQTLLFGAIFVLEIG